MSDNLPFEIRMEIMKRLPVKSLIQFRTVSKPWKCLIDSSDFIAHYSRYHTQMQHILVSYESVLYPQPIYLSIADDHTFPQHVYFNTPLLLKMLQNLTIVGCSHGLLCLLGFYPKTRKYMAVFWNLSMTRVIPIVMPNVVYNKTFDTCISFSVCRATTDPKIIKITYIKSASDIESISCIPCQVEVFSLSTGAWRSPHSNLPRKSIIFYGDVAIDGLLYWHAKDRIIMDGGFSSYNLIISFDITSEEFREVNLPRSLAHVSVLYVSKLRESLVVVHSGEEDNNSFINVWRMEDGVSNLFTKLYTINVDTLNTLDADVNGFRKSGEPIIQISIDDLPTSELVVYDPYSKHVDGVGVDGIACHFFVHPYMETLLLLDQPNFAVYNEMETIRYLDDLVS
ncbi:hypothetical protein QVD17_40319 [Tagetes erecta]|uniref:F-box domain-containing protein n=1 Tax=Tagetes erecta TaxID=13708 RepID=A0AAD8JTR0_TARER|nr:hypothetical protein QVD17_40319 [Tagetes erecta]